MMTSDPSSIMIDQPCADAVLWTLERLREAGFRVLQTFNLTETRGTLDNELIVLLVYGSGSQPVSLVAHGDGSRTRLQMVETFYPLDPGFKDQVRAALT